MAMQKIHEWLKGYDSHGIYDAAAVAEDFTKSTGHEPCWSTQSVKEVRREIKRRGLGGSVRGPDNARMISGFDLADSLARKFANHYSEKMGRGFLFWDCQEALKQKDV